MNRNPAEPNPFQFSEITPEQLRQQLEATLRANPHDTKALRELGNWLQQNGSSEAEKARGEFIVLSLIAETYTFSQEHPWFGKPTKTQKLKLMHRNC